MGGGATDFYSNADMDKLGRLRVLRVKLIRSG